MVAASPNHDLTDCHFLGLCSLFLSSLTFQRRCEELLVDAESRSRLAYTNSTFGYNPRHAQEPAKTLFTGIFTLGCLHHPGHHGLPVANRPG